MFNSAISGTWNGWSMGPFRINNTVNSAVRYINYTSDRTAYV